MNIACKGSQATFLLGNLVPLSVDKATQNIPIISRRKESLNISARSLRQAATESYKYL